jgi:uncharacterized Tic20 family protein
VNLADSVTEPAGVPTQDERTWGMVAHLAALAFFIFPFGNILGPLIVYLTRRDQSAFVAAHAREALNFNITMALGALVSCLLLLFFIGVIFAALIFVFWLAMTIVAALKANEGLPYRYPFTVRLVT